MSTLRPETPPLTLAQSLRRAQALGLERIDAQLLHLFALGREPHDRAWLLAHDTDTLDELVLARLEPLLQRRLGGEPLAYITGTKEFFGLPLQVDARVLDPRPDTETLVEWALEHMPRRHRVRSSIWAPAAAPSPWLCSTSVRKPA